MPSTDEQARSDAAEMLRQDREQQATFQRVSTRFEANALAQAEQLLRLAERAPKVSIYLLNKACEVWIWLCSKHRARREKDGWSVKEIRTPRYTLNCQDCR